MPGLGEVLTGFAGCRSWSGSTDGGSLRVVAVDDVVAQVVANGEVTSALPVAMGDRLEDVRAAYPQLTARHRDMTNTSYEVADGDRVVTVDLWPEDRWVDDVDVAISGGPAVVRSLDVRDAAVEVARLC